MDKKVLDTLVDAGQSATLEFFEMMCPMDVEVGDVVPATGNREKFEIVSTIGITGDVKGSYAVLVNKPLGTQIVSQLLNLDEPDENDVYDTVGEFCNIVSGGAKTIAASNGINFDIGCPTVISGTDAEVVLNKQSHGAVMNFKANGLTFNVLISIVDE